MQHNSALIKQIEAKNEQEQKKDARIKELQESVAAIEKKWVDTSANRKQAAQSQAVVHWTSGMSEEQEKDAINFAKQAFQEKDSLFHMAVYISRQFEKKHEGDWNCIVGIEEGYDLYYYSSTFIAFSLGAYEIILFREN